MNEKENHLKESNVKEYLSYSETTGEFTWIKSRGSKRKMTRAGTINSEGYVSIEFNNYSFKAHRLAWFFKTGNFPDFEVDHKNGVRNDNRFLNLRACTRSQNTQNKKKYSVKSDLPQSIYPGVTWSRVAKKWHSRISKDGKKHFLGSFDDPEKAYFAYLEKKKELHDFFDNKLR